MLLALVSPTEWDTNKHRHQLETAEHRFVFACIMGRQKGQEGVRRVPIGQGIANVATTANQELPTAGLRNRYEACPPSPIRKLR